MKQTNIKQREQYAELDQRIRKLQKENGKYATKEEVSEGQAEIKQQVNTVLADVASFKETTTIWLDVYRAKVNVLQAEDVIIKDTLRANNAAISKLEAGTAEFQKTTTTTLEAYNGEITNLKAKDVVIEGELTAQSLSISELSAQQAQFESATAENFTAVNAYITSLSGDVATFKETTTATLNAQSASISQLHAKDVEIESIVAKKATIEHLEVVEGKIDTLTSKAITTDNLSAKVADLGYATAENLNAAIGSIKTLETNSLTAQSAIITALQAKDADIEELVATKATIEALNAATARIGKIEGDYITAGELNAEIAKIDKAKIDTAEVNTLLAQKAGVTELNALSGTVDDLSAKEAVFESATAENFKAVNAEIETIESNYVKTSTLTADYTTTKDLQAQYATISSLNSANAEINTLKTNKLDVTTASAKYATITNLNAAVGRITTLETNSLTADSAIIKTLQSDIADIDTLIFGSASGTSIHTSFANAVIAQLGNAQIKSAMIDAISADKITSGSINTNNVNIRSVDGSMVISDNTIQINDGSTIRVQIGKDASGNYSIVICDTDGNVMFNTNGITADAIKSAIIRNDMVAANANISASKLDINSLFTEINGSSNTIKSTQIYVDDEKQTLDVVFREMTSTVGDLGETVSSQGTQISAIQGQITSKIWQQDINEAKGEMSTQYTSLSQTVSGLSSTVGQHTTRIAQKANSAEVQSTYATKTEVTQTAQGLSVDISSAARTATNFLNFSGGGLVIGDMTAIALGKNVLIDSDSVDIRNGDTVLASFSANTIELGKEATDVNRIYLLGRTGYLFADGTIGDTAYDRIGLAGASTQLHAERSIVISANTGSESQDGSTEILMNALSTGESEDSMIYLKAYDRENRSQASIWLRNAPSDNTAKVTISAYDLNVRDSNYIDVSKDGLILHSSGDDFTSSVTLRENGLRYNGVQIATINDNVASATTLSQTLPVSKGGTGATTVAAALVNLGLTATATELNYMDGVTSNVQTQLNGKAASGHTHSAYLTKTTYEYNKELAMGGSGKICIGKFSMYDSNITVRISSTTSTTYNATLVIATQNYGTASGGSFTANVYGDVSNTIAPNIYIYNVGTSGVVEVYFSPATYSKNLVHVQCMALRATPTDVLTSITSIPTTATTKPTNLLTAALGEKAALAGNNTFSGKNIFEASNSYNTVASQKFVVGNSSSAFVFGGDGLQCFGGTSSTTGKIMYINYYGGDVSIGKSGGSQVMTLHGNTTINGGSSDTPLQLNSASTGSYIGFGGTSSARMGFLGFSGVNAPTFYHTTDGAKTLLHSGNYNSYALSLTGGELTGKLTVGSASLETNGYVTGTWLKTTANIALNTAATAFAVLNGGWIYSRTAAQVLSDIGAAAAGHTHSYLPSSGGDLTGALNFNTGTTQSATKGITWSAINSKNPYIGYATDQTDGTFVVASILGTNYASGLAIGGGSGNLLYKGNVVLNASNYSAYAAPQSHKSTGQGHGVGDDTYYGHLKLSNSTNSTSSTGGGIAATPAAVKAAYDLAAAALPKTGTATKAVNDQNGKQIDRIYCSMVPAGTNIPANADLNTVDYIKVGNYYCSSNANAKTLKNSPITVAFMMQVYSPLSTTIDNETTGTYVYRIRKLINYSNGDEYVQKLQSSGTAGTFTYTAWKKIAKDTDSPSFADLTATGNIYLSTNSKALYAKDANGNNREVMRINNSTSSPTLVIGDGLYTAGIGVTNVGAGTEVKLITKNNRVILTNVSSGSYNATFKPYTNNSCALGDPTYKWHVVYAVNGTIQTSDRREKENIMPLGLPQLMPVEDGAVATDLHSELFDRLKPVQYSFINGNKKISYGLIAQDVIEAMHEIGIDENALDLVHHDFYTDNDTGEEKETYGLGYNNLIALLIHEVQKLKFVINQLKGEQAC